MAQPPLRYRFAALLTALVAFVPVSARVNLPFGDINVVVLTDVHSWVAGHGVHEPDLSADYGDIVSFYEKLKQLAPDRDVFFVMNGDLWN